DRQVPLFAGLRDRDAVDVLHHEVRHTAFGGAAVEEARDVRVPKRGEDLPFVAEAAEHVLAEDALPHELERGLHPELRIRAADEEDRPHAAVADLAHELPRADAASLERLRDAAEEPYVRDARLRGRLQEAVVLPVQGEELADLGAKRLVVAARQEEPLALA